MEIIDILLFLQYNVICTLYLIYLTLFNKTALSGFLISFPVVLFFLCRKTFFEKNRKNFQKTIDFCTQRVYNKDTIKERETPERKEATTMTINRANGTVTFTSEEMNSIKAINAASRAEAMEQVAEILNRENRYSAKYNLVKASKEIVIDGTMVATIKYSKGEVKCVDFLDIDNPFFAIVKIK